MPYFVRRWRSVARAAEIVTKGPFVDAARSF